MTRARIGIALGSGSARGWAHIGVLRALSEAGIVPDIICGTSVGALVGGAYLADRLDALDDWARSITLFDIVGLLDVTLARGGVIAGARLFKGLRNIQSDQLIEDLPKPFAAVATDFATGRELWLQKGSLLDAAISKPNNMQSTNVSIFSNFPLHHLEFPCFVFFRIHRFKFMARGKDLESIEHFVCLR